MLSRTFWTLRCHSNIPGAQFCKYFSVSRVFMIVTVAHCFVAIFSMLLESTVTGLIMCCFYACLIDHLLVSFFVGLLDCRWFITSLKWNDTSDTHVCVMLLGSYFSIQGYLCKPTRTFFDIYALCLPMSYFRSDTFE